DVGTWKERWRIPGSKNAVFESGQIPADGGDWITCASARLDRALTRSAVSAAGRHIHRLLASSEVKCGEFTWEVVPLTGAYMVVIGPQWGIISYDSILCPDQVVSE